METTLVSFTDTIFWKKETPFLTCNGNELIERIKNKTPTFEVITNDIKPKLYFDIDHKIEKEEYDESVANIIEEKGLKYLEESLYGATNVKPNISIATSHSKTYTETHGKYSIRYFVSNIKSNKKSIQQFVQKLNKIIINMRVDNIGDYIEVENGKLFDEGIYDSNRKMRCINTSKPNENRPLVLKTGTIENTIITDFYDTECVELQFETEEDIKYSSIYRHR